MFIDVNSHVRVDDLVHGMLIQSGNDASIGARGARRRLRRGVRRADERESRGARHAEQRVQESDGLARARALHVSSAHDLGVLARAIISTFPKYYGLYAEREFSYNGSPSRTATRCSRATSASTA
jgi:D-alanyl-D-alanine carboxypeptidase (penicillin-binding protein 5/6)